MEKKINIYDSYIVLKSKICILIGMYHLEKEMSYLKAVFNLYTFLIGRYLSITIFIGYNHHSLYFESSGVYLCGERQRGRERARERERMREIEDRRVDFL